MHVPARDSEDFEFDLLETLNMTNFDEDSTGTEQFQSASQCFDSLRLFLSKKHFHQASGKRK